MANPERLLALKGGSAVWNRWRAENPQKRSDFRFADLGGLDLEGANLQGANKMEAALEGVRRTDIGF